VQTEQKQYANVRATWSAPLVGVATTLQFVGATFSGLSDMVANLFSGLWGFVTGNAAETKNIAAAGESVAGPVSILGVIFPSALAAGPTQLFWLMGIISLTLTVMNVLPIPGLDGGHVLFLLVEVITRRKPSDKFMEYAQMTGMILLFGLLIWANFNDILRFFF
jgi:membrane-associated protease RseP (regulator of RpoE activity)